MEIKSGVILTPRSDTDFIAGEVSGVTYEHICDDWTPYIPKFEKQKFTFNGVKLETSHCTNFSAMTDLEFQGNRMIVEELIPKDILEYLIAEKWIVDGQFNFSDRASGKMSGTTENGNTLVNVWDSARHDGVLPEADWTFSDQDELTFENYNKDLPEELIAKAKKFLDFFEIQYEWVQYRKYSQMNQGEIDNLRYHLYQAPLQLATPTCNWGETIEPCSADVTHATCLYNIDDYLKIEDTYDPYLKNMSLQYLVPFALKGILIPKFKTMETNVKLVKNGNEIGFYVPATNQEALKDKGMNFGKEIPLSEDNVSVDWDALEKNIEADLTLRTTE